MFAKRSPKGIPLPLVFHEGLARGARRPRVVVFQLFD